MKYRLEGTQFSKQANHFFPRKLKKNEKTKKYFSMQKNGLQHEIGAKRNTIF